MNQEVLSYSTAETTSPTEHGPALSSRTRRLMGGACLALTLFTASGCGETSKDTSNGIGATSELDEVQFNKPDSGDYFLDVDNPYYDQVRSVLEQTDDKAAAGRLNRLLETPIPQWINGDMDYSRQLITENLRDAKTAGQIPAFVLYNIPERDLGGAAKGGMDTPEDYQEWIDMVSQEIGESPAVLVLEPDALPGVTQMSRESGDERLVMLRNAMITFRDNNPKTAVYLDAGHSAWHPPTLMAELIQELEHDEPLVGGIALNVSNRRSEQSTVDYAQAIQQALGRKLDIMIDVSRNGGTDTDHILTWCNAEGEGLGRPEDYRFDASNPTEEMIIKGPGESDGPCGTSDKPSGVFDSKLLEKLVS